MIHTIQEMMDWLAKLCGLPERFLHSAGKGGGGVIQVSYSCFILKTYLMHYD